jgi:hypothetical protein
MRYQSGVNEWELLRVKKIGTKKLGGVLTAGKFFSPHKKKCCGQSF